MIDIHNKMGDYIILGLKDSMEKVIDKKIDSSLREAVLWDIKFNNGFFYMWQTVRREVIDKIKGDI